MFGMILPIRAARLEKVSLVVNCGLPAGTDLIFLRIPKMISTKVVGARSIPRKARPSFSPSSSTPSVWVKARSYVDYS